MIEMTPEKWLAVLTVANIPVYILVGWVFFTNWAGFLECVGFSMTPEGILRFSPNLQADVFWIKMKILFFLITCIAIVIGEYKFMKQRSLLKEQITFGQSSSQST